MQLQRTTPTVDARERETRGRAATLAHPHKQRGEAKGRSAMADLHSWQPSHRLIIREGADGEDGGEVEDETLRGDGGSCRALISEGQSFFFLHGMGVTYLYIKGRMKGKCKFRLRRARALFAFS